jgi:endonuclease-3 related protein
LRFQGGNVPVIILSLEPSTPWPLETYINMAKRNQNRQEVLTVIYNILYAHFGPQHWWPGDTPFEIAVGAILTQNTNWDNVVKAIGNLKKNGSLNATVMHRMSHDRLASLIKPAGYFNVKAKRLKHFLNFISNHYRGSMKIMKKEDTRAIRENLLSVNGIGPETADSILLYALEKPVFVIDAYTKRILRRHEIISDKTTYHELQALFHGSLPADLDLFNEYHALFVMLGKHYCKPEPRCSACPLENSLRSSSRRT